MPLPCALPETPLIRPSWTASSAASAWTSPSTCATASGCGACFGDFGYSFGWNKPVSDLIWERLALTVVVTFTALIFTWIVGFLIGVYSATHQYSMGDYAFTTVSFVGLGIPDFLIALVLLWVGFRYFNANRDLSAAGSRRRPPGPSGPGLPHRPTGRARRVAG